MGFPRIISKTHKIYTKLGEFCLSGDGNQFWIVCHTCQEELQTQDKFWKHIQDEHNFMHGIKQEPTRASGSTYMETGEPAGVMPLPLYRKVSVNEQQREEATSGASEEDDIQKEAKDYTEMRTHDMENNQTVAIDIKLEPSLSQSMSTPEQAQQQQQQQSQTQQQQQHTPHQLEMSATPLMYQLPQVHPPVSAYAALVQVPAINTLNMTVAAAAAAAQVPTSMAALMPQDLPKDNATNINNNNTTNSTTASASSAVSSDDGERWYICDYENCGLKFKYQSRLELHRSVHSKERRFACEICGASFKQSCNLSTHRKKKHALKGVKSTLIPPQRF
ncbi:(A+T)-stretch binding protein [Glossina fuscipes fuscipes]